MCSQPNFGERSFSKHIPENIPANFLPNHRPLRLRSPSPSLRRLTPSDIIAAVIRGLGVFSTNALSPWSTWGRRHHCIWHFQFVKYTPSFTSMETFFFLLPKVLIMTSLLHLHRTAIDKAGVIKILSPVPLNHIVIVILLYFPQFRTYFPTIPQICFKTRTSTMR